MSWSTVWKSFKNKDMRNRIFAVLGMLIVFRFLAHVPVPIADQETLKQILDNLFSVGDSQFLNFLNLASGGALANFSIMIVGLGPYINASIIMQLLTKAIPKLETLNKEGEYGRKKINQYTRMLTFPLAVIQSVGAIFLVRQAATQVGGIGDITSGVTPIEWVLMISALTGGAMVLMWLGELITEKGIGNGISLLITVGIVSQLPQTISTVVKAVVDDSSRLAILGLELPINKSQLLFAVILTSVTLAVTVAIVKLSEASRRLTIHYAKRVQGSRAYGGVSTALPVKLITAGVIPIIFAVAFLSVPSFLGQIFLSSSSETLINIGANLNIWFANPSAQTFATGGFEPFIYPVVYFVLVFVFTFFYTGISFNSKEIAENLQKQGGFIEGIRAGEATEKYLGKVVNRLTLFGATSLGFIALLPIIGQVFISSSIALGGTSILILVSVALETLRQVESRALMVTYDQYEQPDFFQDLEQKANTTATSKKRRRLLPGRSKKAKK